MGFIASCGLALVLLSGTAFAQQPSSMTPTKPEASCGSRNDGRTSRPQASLNVGPNVSERERILLERIEQLERRLSEVESRLDTTAATGVKAAALTSPFSQVVSASPQAISGSAAQSGGADPPRLAGAAVSNTVAPSHPSLTTTNAFPPANIAVSTPKSTQTTQKPPLPKYAAWDKDGVKIIPYGILIANVNYNTSALLPGSWSAFAFPHLLPDQDQFNVSPGNTYLGVDVKWPKIGKWEIDGKVDFNLRGADPLAANNIFAPQFIHIYGEAKTERYHILAGQTDDVVAPVFPNTLNQYPITYMPGSLGYFRPQIRFDTYQPIGGNFTFIFQGALTQAIQTLDVGTLRLSAVDFEAEVFGRQTGLPDGQARVALGHGKPAPNDPLQKRPFEIGLSGHLGKRRGTLLTVPVIERDFTSWSGTIDLGFKMGRKLRFEGEYFGGSVLGDYAGGIFQTFNPQRGVAIRATGAWAQLIYDISDKWQVNGGYGRDDPYNRDLSFAQRSLSEMAFGNVFYRITPRLWVAAEFSRWRTNWVGLPAGRAFRVEPAVLFFF